MADVKQKDKAETKTPAKKDGKNDEKEMVRMDTHVVNAVDSLYAIIV